jgi:hypothetical protein
MSDLKGIGFENLMDGVIYSLPIKKIYFIRPEAGTFSM